MKLAALIDKYLQEVVPGIAQQNGAAPATPADPTQVQSSQHQTLAATPADGEEDAATHATPGAA
jgi:ribosomal protein L12E/L44/L45/RPP1/RPP2